MSDVPAIVDADLLQATRQHVAAALGLDTGVPVPGDGLVHGFARLAAIVSDRINSAADKNFLAFLDLVGVQQTAPQAARVPLTFTLAPGATGDVLVAAGAVAAAPAGAATPKVVLFETERDLLVTGATLTAAIVVDPSRDRLSDAASALGGQGSAGVDPFVGTTPIRHRLLIGSSDAWALGSSQYLALGFESVGKASDWLGAVAWAWWDGSAWQPMSPTTPPGANEIAFDPVPPIPLTTVGGVTSRWIAATLATALPATDVSRDAVTGAIRVAARASPDAAFADNDPLDPTEPFAPFGTAGAAVAFALRADAAFGKPGAEVSVRIDLDPSHPVVAPSGFSLIWEYWNGTAWTPLTIATEPDVPGLDPSGLLGSGTVTFPAPADWAAVAWPPSGGGAGYWLRISRPQRVPYTTVPIVDGLSVQFSWTAPRLSGATVSSRVDVDAAQGLVPDAALVNGVTVDATRNFLAFGARPGPGDALYLACDEAIDASRTEVTADIVLTAEITSSPSAELAWEYWDATAGAWTALVQGQGLDDETHALTTSGTVTITPPAAVGAVQVGGQTRRWLRIVLVNGDYGHDAALVPDSNSPTGYTLSPATLSPPSIASVRFGYAAQRTDQAPALLTVEDWAPPSGPQQISAAPLVADGAFDPFTPIPDAEPALMLGFREAFANAGVDLYFEVAPAYDASATAATAPQVVWEYNDGSSWRALGARDETGALSSSGLVSFVGPVDLVRTIQVGTTAAWLRARLIAADEPPQPALVAVRTDTMWASQQQSVAEEVLGSGTGQPNQQYQTTQQPVLEGQLLEVLEPETPSLEELAALGPSALRPAQDASGHQTGVWVSWLEVDDFVTAKPRDRAYAIDRVKGTITFGDGKRGLVPPVGRANIVLTYRTGGGQSGNLPVDTITQLRTAVPFVSAVINHEPSNGGADPESLGLVGARGPRTLRHRERAVAAADVEDLAQDASSSVARSLAVPASAGGAAGWVGLVVVPAQPGPRPTPDGQLLAQMRTYVSERMGATVQLWVSGPGWLEVTVTTGLVPISVEQAADVGSAAGDALRTFLDPLTGGPTETGWPFGRQPHPADLIALLETLEGVDHVAWLSLDATIIQTAPTAAAFLVCSGEHTITMLNPGATA